MKLINQIRDQLDHLKSYIEGEKELLKLKAVKFISAAAANVAVAVFSLLLLHLLLIMAGIWWGFYLSTLFDSYTMGFGFSALTFLVLLLLLILLRKPLLVNPVVNMAIRALVKKYRLPDDKKQEATGSKD